MTRLLACASALAQEMAFQRIASFQTTENSDGEPPEETAPEIVAPQEPAVVTNAIRATRGGMPTQKLDMEGIAPDGGGGFWIANEGRTDRLIPTG